MAGIDPKSRAQLLGRESKLRLGSNKLVICPVTSISDPGGDEAERTGLVQSHWLAVVACWSRAKPPAGLGTPAMLMVASAGA